MIAHYPARATVDENLLQQVEDLRAVVTGVREIRNQHNVPNSKQLTLHASSNTLISTHGVQTLMAKLAFLERIAIDGKAPEDALQILVGKEKYLLDLPVERNIEEEKVKLSKELEYLQGFILSVEKKLGNERFVANASTDVVERERKKLEDGRAKLNSVKEALEKL